MRGKRDKQSAAPESRKAADKRAVILYGAAAVIMTVLSVLIMTGKIRGLESVRESTEEESGGAVSGPEIPAESGSAAAVSYSALPPVTEPSAPAASVVFPSEEGLTLPDSLSGGFVFSRELTEELFARLATVNTNNSDPESPYRSFPSEMLRELDRLSVSFALGALGAEELKTAAEALSFVWTDDPYAVRHAPAGLFAGVLELAGSDTEAAYRRVLLTDTAARHYLFVRVYRDPAGDRIRVYLVNGMVW